MSDPGDVADRVIDAVNARDIDALRSLYAPNARTRRPGWPEESDPQALLASYQMDFVCVPDIRLNAVSTLTEGPHVVTELRSTGTNTGPTILGDFGKALLAPTSKRCRHQAGRSTSRPCSSTRSATASSSASASTGACFEFLVQTGAVGG